MRSTTQEAQDIRHTVKCVFCKRPLRKAFDTGEVFCDNKDCETFVDKKGNLYFAERPR